MKRRGKAAGEFERIAAFVRHFPRARVPVGIGDDCAVLPGPRRGHEVCVTTDAVVEDVHFTRAAFSMEDIGHKALAVNLSDLAAMGAAPAWFVCALGLPGYVGGHELDGLAGGMAKLAKQAGITLVGGNMTRSDKLSLTLTVAGEVPKGKALLRSGAKAGDLLYMSGTLGDARAGLIAVQPERSGAAAKSKSQQAAKWLAGRQRRPVARLGLGVVARRFASACIDVSDGIGQDLGHVCAASGVGAQVRVGALPLSEALREWAGEAARDFALAGGEDYELLLAIPARAAKAFEAACSRVGERVTCVGSFTRGRAIRFVADDGRSLRRPGGYDHFPVGE